MGSNWSFPTATGGGGVLSTGVDMSTTSKKKGERHKMRKEGNGGRTA